MAPLSTFLPAFHFRVLHPQAGRQLPHTRGQTPLRKIGGSSPSWAGVACTLSGTASAHHPACHLAACLASGGRHHQAPPGTVAVDTAFVLIFRAIDLDLCRNALWTCVVGGGGGGEWVQGVRRGIGVCGCKPIPQLLARHAHPATLPRSLRYGHPRRASTPATHKEHGYVSGRRPALHMRSPARGVPPLPSSFGSHRMNRNEHI